MHGEGHPPVLLSEVRVVVQVITYLLLLLGHRVKLVTNLRELPSHRVLIIVPGRRRGTYIWTRTHTFALIVLIIVESSTWHASTLVVVVRLLEVQMSGGVALLLGFLMGFS